MEISFFKRFYFRLTLAFIAAMVFVVLLSNLVIYQFTLESQFEGLRGRLKMIAQTAALLVDSEILAKVPLSREGIQFPAYQIIAGELRKIKEANPQIQYIYTMTKTEEDGIWQFVVDPEPAAKEEKSDSPTSFPGDRYNAARFPEMLRAFEIPSVDTKLEVDEWGVTLSGYAPIRNRDGQTVAVLGIDVKADDVYNLRKEVYERTVVILALGLILSLILGVIISAQISRPIEELSRATHQLATGNLTHRIPASSKDEIGELAKSFNFMAKNLEESRQRILGFFYDVVKSLVRVLELRDHYTSGHSEAVSEYAAKIAHRLGISGEKIEKLKKMTLLHDIGKIGVKDSILHKQGSLTPEEWEAIKQHPLLGEEILKPVMGQEEMLAVVKEHHERHDGKGYPRQLSGDDISIFASIVSVADAYHAMTSDRSYRQALSPQEAVEELKKNSGTQFHPKIVEIFLQVLEEEKKQV